LPETGWHKNHCLHLKISILFITHVCNFLNALSKFVHLTTDSSIRIWHYFNVYFSCVSNTQLNMHYFEWTDTKESTFDFQGYERVSPGWLCIDKDLWSTIIMTIYLYFKKHYLSQSRHLLSFLAFDLLFMPQVILERLYMKENYPPIFKGLSTCTEEKIK
jgi:hypothetical protein